MGFRCFTSLHCICVCYVIQIPNKIFDYILIFFSLKLRLPNFCYSKSINYVLTLYQKLNNSTFLTFGPENSVVTFHV